MFLFNILNAFFKKDEALKRKVYEADKKSLFWMLVHAGNLVVIV